MHGMMHGAQGNSARRGRQGVTGASRFCSMEGRALDRVPYRTIKAASLVNTECSRTTPPPEPLTTHAQAVCQMQDRFVPA
jgi:hypothetical protein